MISLTRTYDKKRKFSNLNPKFRCSVTALSHAMRRDAEKIYRGMVRDMEVLVHGAVSSYTPGELCTYLFKEGVQHLLLNNFEVDAIHPDELGVPCHGDVVSWGFAGRPMTLALVVDRPDHRFGHWVGYDGTTVNNLGVLGFPTPEMTWDAFVTETENLRRCPDAGVVMIQFAILMRG